MEHESPTCPGCHIGCRVSRYQCANGKRLHDRWIEGEQLPERRKPPEGKRKPLPAHMRDELVTHMLQAVNAALGECTSAQLGHEMVIALERHGGKATEAVLCERCRCERGGLDVHFQQLETDGVLVFEEESGRTFACLTDAGFEAAERAKLARQADNNEFLQALSGDERQQLLDLVFKLLSGLRQPHHARDGSAGVHEAARCCAPTCRRSAPTKPPNLQQTAPLSWTR